MSIQKQAILLVGSLKRTKSTSDFMGSYLLSLLSKNGFQTKKMYIGSLDSKEKRNELLSYLDHSDIVIFSSPLYIDCEPYLVIKAMEAIAEHRKNNKSIKRSLFLVISNGGYPEAQHNNTALSIYHHFASECDFEWAGGLAMGMGAAFSISAVRGVGPIIGNLKKAIEITASALSNNKPIPNQAIKLMAKAIVPIWIYSCLARGIARFFSITNGAWNIYLRPSYGVGK